MKSSRPTYDKWDHPLYIKELRDRSEARVAADREFRWISEDLAADEAEDRRQQISLNEKARRQEMADDKAREDKRVADARSTASRMRRITSSRWTTWTSPNSNWSTTRPAREPRRPKPPMQKPPMPTTRPTMTMTFPPGQEAGSRPGAQRDTAYSHRLR